MQNERLLRAVALQLAIAVCYVVAFRVQMALPPLPGSALAAIFFVPSVVRVFATLLTGGAAFFGLFAGSMIISLQVPVYEEHVWLHALASAGSAPFAVTLFRRLGLLPNRANLLRAADTPMVLVFIASYAVVNAGMHLVGLATIDSALSSHLPYFLLMVAGDFLPAAGGFVLFRAASRLFGRNRAPLH